MFNKNVFRGFSPIPRQLGIVLLIGLGITTSVNPAPLEVAADTDMWRRSRSNFVNWENPHVHPLDITPDQSQLLAVNTPDNSLLVFDIVNGGLQLAATIPVGIDPVSVRARTNNEVWVVNHVSDTVSVVDLNEERVIAVLQTDDEPADVVFAGDQQRAFVSISQQNRMNIFDVFNLNEAPQSIFINGEDPRSLAVSPDGNKVYLAVFESGNGTTLLNGGKSSGCCEIDIVSDSRGPYGGIGIPPNDGNQYNPPVNPAISLPSAAPMIVRKDENGNWLDDNNRDWSSFVSGDLSSIGGRNRGRVQGWDFADRDVAIIDANSLSVSYQHRLMNANMALAVQPETGEVTVVGTDASNEIRWEPNLKSTFVRVKMAKFFPGENTEVFDLNPHLTYNTQSISQSQRNQSIGDPRGIAWNSDGTLAYITGMGSNNVAVINDSAERVSLIEVGEGPTGIVLNKDSTMAFVMNKFDASISVLDLNSEQEVNRISFYDPTPEVIKTGRKLLYDTHQTSGLGQASCASCHIDGRTDRLAWDLGDPSGDMVPMVGSKSAQNSPVKGPLLTMTLQDVIGHKMMHWAGDRENLGKFDHAFVNLQGADSIPTPDEMLEFEAFLATIAIPPNPNRNLDNNFSTSLPLAGPNGTVARVGNAVAGAAVFEDRCRRCHAGDSARGEQLRNGGPFAIQHIRPPTWRNFHERTGLWYQSENGSNSGFGFQQDGGFDSTHNNTRTADMMAFMHSVNGRFPYVPTGLDEETQSHDTHAAVGRQVILGGAGAGSSTSLVNTLLTLADRGEIGVIAQQTIDDENRGYAYIGEGQFQSDRSEDTISAVALRNSAQSGASVIYTSVPAGSETRIGIDRDMDGVFNGDEIDQFTDPSDPGSFPGSAQCSTLENVALKGVASQSSNYRGTRFPASLAIDGNKRNFTHTDSNDAGASWSLDLDNTYDIESIVLHNRTSCCASRLRDLTVYITDDTGEHSSFRSPFINRHNQMNSPKSIVLDLVSMTGSSVRGGHIKVIRTPDALGAGLNGGSGSDHKNVLALGEVEVMACPLTEKNSVTIYEHGGYRGRSKSLPPGRYNINDLGIGNDRLSSLKVPTGWRVTLFQHVNFTGRTEVLTSGTSFVSTLNDQTSSIIVSSTTLDSVVIYDGEDFSGSAQALQPGRYKLNDLTIGNDSVSSLKVPEGWTVTLLVHDNFIGRSAVVTKDESLYGEDFNNRTSSIIVRSTTPDSVVIYDGEDFSGNSQTLQPGRYNIGDLTIGNDRLSSLRIPEGWTVTLLAHGNFLGQSLVVTKDESLYGEHFNNSTSSIIVEKPE